MKNAVTDLTFIKREQLKELEPAVSASAALYSPSTGILDSHRYMERLLNLAQGNGVIFAPRTSAKNIYLKGNQFKVSTEVESDVAAHGGLPQLERMWYWEDKVKKGLRRKKIAVTAQ